MDTIDPRPLDILDGGFYVDDPHSRYAWLRENSPIHWDEVNGLWVVTRYDDILAIESDKATFINSAQEPGGYRPNIPADPALIGLDDPLHTARRNLVARRFTPKGVTRWEDHIGNVSDEIIDEALSRGDVEVVADLASALPARMIALLLGFPEETWPQLKHWSETTIGLGGGPRYMTEDRMTAVMEFAGASAELYQEKRACPGDDVMSRWIEVEDATGGRVGGAPFGLDEIISDCLLLLDGGAETTRTVIARIVLELADRSDQWDLLRGGADLTVAVEEFIRWVTPIHNFCRVAVRDAEVGGQPIAAGQQVLLCYASANRDPAHFDDPEDFDVTRTPNHHLSFGFGTHFCLGAALARLEIGSFFERLIDRVERIERLPDLPHVEMPNAFVFGLSESHVRLHPDRRG